MSKDTWLVSTQDLSSDIELAPSSSRRVAKTVECGVAALTKLVVKDDPDGILDTTIEPRMFNTLPLPIASDLPVHFHASFSLSGDRKSIAWEEYGSTSPGAVSNKYLLQCALPKLYLEVLSDLVDLIYQDCFDFWPHTEPPKKSFGLQVFEAFWSELSTFARPIFPKARVAKNTKRQTVKIQQAVFDFLPKKQSEVLLKLLLQLGVNLIREVPLLIAKRIQQIPDLKHVNGSILRELLKSEDCEPKLLKATKENPAVWDELFRIIDPHASNEDPKDMDGCHVLPLANGSLGTLRVVEENQSADYYLANSDEQIIFSFASSKLVLLRNELLMLVGRTKFNVKRLQLNHVGELLKLRPDVLTPNAVTDGWLVKFWDYWNLHHTGTGHPDVVEFDAKLYKATRDGVDHYLAPAQFEQSPAIVVPSSSEHKKLCQQLPGLYLVKSNTIPKTLAQAEKSLDNIPSFSRFIRALGTLGSQAGIGNLVANNIKDANKQVSFTSSRHFLATHSWP